MEMLNTVRCSKVINDCNMIVTTYYAPENEPWNLKITQLKSKMYLPNLHLFGFNILNFPGCGISCCIFVSHVWHLNLPSRYSFIFACLASTLPFPNF